MTKKSKKKDYEDDGRVISPMNVDGMPWHQKSTYLPQENKQDSKDEEEIYLSSGEKRAMMGGVFAAALLVAGAFVLAGLLFILFCVFVWLR